jgi:hypothetical protein
MVAVTKNRNFFKWPKLLYFKPECAKFELEGGAVGHNFERDPPRDHLCQVWFNLVQQFQRRRFKCDLLSKYA